MYAKNLPKAVAVNGRLSRAVFKKRIPRTLSYLICEGVLIEDNVSAVRIPIAPASDMEQDFAITYRIILNDCSSVKPLGFSPKRSLSQLSRCLGKCWGYCHKVCPPGFCQYSALLPFLLFQTSLSFHSEGRNWWWSLYWCLIDSIPFHEANIHVKSHHMLIKQGIIS